MKETIADRIVGAAIYILLTLILLAVLYPLVFVVSASISDPLSVSKGEMWLFPKDLSFIGYERIFSNPEIWTGYINTIVYTLVGTFLNLVMTIMAAYPLSRKDFRGAMS
ncbi:hypothetical protein PACILC2_50790 [Paenibacillus cisolokensis]|uniref:Sugar ABC transporter permease n=1 Tax=Paenibacillus cisolokensis TaxID=1658519 RepID=A0ABQ4NF64_9BACL|nr:hypothetical protein PACILC2_50790 [Paenibacillus cisolokensis]